jgi:toxin ParE1/3/4
MKVILAATARADLREIGLRIASDNTPRAITFVQELMDRCLSLSEHPERFPVAVERKLPLHKMTHAGYLIFYTVGDSKVDILRIVHGARDWSKLFDV